MRATKILLVMVSFGLVGPAFAQQGGGMKDPSERIAKEKAAVLEKVTDLNEDQKLIFDQIYLEFETTVVEMRKSGDFQAMREKMTEIRKKKDKAIEDLFTEKQYNLYKEVVNRRYGQRQRRDPNK